METHDEGVAHVGQDSALRLSSLDLKESHKEREKSHSNDGTTSS